MAKAPPNPHYRALYQWEAPEGKIVLECPHVLSPESVAEFEELLSIILRGMKRRAAKAKQDEVAHG